MTLLEAPADALPSCPVGPLVPPRTDRSPGVQPRQGRQRTDWEQLAAYRVAVVNFLRSRCRDVHQAEDIAQDAIIRAVQSRRSRGPGGVGNIRPWLVQIAANLHRDAHRKESFESLVPDDSPVFAASEGREPVPGDHRPGTMIPMGERAIDSADLVEDLRRVMARLPDRDRVLLTSYYIEGCSLAETARRAGCEVRLAKVWMYRARRRLEGRLRQRFGSEVAAGSVAV